MESRDFIYFFIGVLSMFVGMFIYPYVMQVKMHIKQYFTRKNTKPAIDATEYFNLQEQIDELREQINNVATNHYRRETNRKNNIRKTVREYLAELRNS